MAKEKLTIVKIGGNIISEDQKLQDTLTVFSHIKGKKLLVHGGGKTASDLQVKLGIQPQMVNGRRITDAESLDVIVMVFAGLVNKTIVSSLQKLGVNAIGITGADGNSILAHKREVEKIDYGFAGDLDNVKTSFFRLILDNGLVPICNPVTHDGKGQLLNTNADTIAASIASSLASKFHIELIFCFELAGVLEDINRPDSVISKLRRHDYLEYQKLGIIQNGMIPKLDNAFFALQQQVAKVYITNAENILNPEKCTEICL